LLYEAGITYKLLSHQSDEDVDALGLAFFQHVLAIAQHKMDHLTLPEYSSETGDYLFVLTADSLVRATKNNQLLGKPGTIENAKKMLRIIRDQVVEVATGCCLEKKTWDGSRWKTDDFKHWVTEALVEFIVDDSSIDLYLEKAPEALHSCGGGVVEGYGQNFFKSIQGSYSAVKGLPIFELRQALNQMNFKF